MRYFTRIASTLTLAIAVAVSAGSILSLKSSPAQAQQAAPMVIGVIDRQALVALSLAGKGLQVAVNQRNKQLNDDSQKRQDAWVKQAQALEQQKATMTPQDYQAKGTELNKQRDQLRLDYQNKKRAIDVAVQQALEQLQNQALAIVKQIITQKNITVLLYKEAVAWSGATVVDITPDVIAQLNQKLPSVKF